ncbi:MAG: DoxX family protein [Nitrosomonas sp.]
MKKLTEVLGRMMLGHIFLIAGLQKIGSYEGTQGYMESIGLPGMLLPLVILLEVGAGLAIIVGWKTRWAAIALAFFSVFAAVLFHNNFSDQIQTIMFMKNIAIAGGLLLLSVYGGGICSIDHRYSKNTVIQ